MSDKETSPTPESKEEDAPPGLLERSAIQEGRRERKKTERLSINAPSDDKDKKRFEIPEGKGTQLGDIPIIEHKLKKTAPEEMKGLHKLLFRTPGQILNVKKNIRKFKGFDFAVGSPEYEKKKEISAKLTIAELKVICSVLDLQVSGTKESVVERMLDFLLQPEDAGKKLPKKKKARKSTGGKSEKGKKRKSTSEKTKDSDTDGEASESDDAKEEPPSDEEGSADDDAGEEAPKKKQKTNGVAKKEKKPKEKKEKPKKTTEKKKKTTPKPKKKEEELVSDGDISPDDDSDSDDEPLAGKKKPALPTDAELQTVVEEILKDADLDEVTMKTVLKDVHAKYPGVDLSEKKAFLKSAVKKIIS